ncbi:MliC family protein [Paracoccus seriniphilus]|uniref:MliC family protein n=1 Tax=Paracoccus seriniphilus TaxID=184748 RepID=UPI0035623D45
MRYILLTLGVLFASPVAGDVALTVDLGPTDQVTAGTYTCGAGETIPVRYVNAGPNALAILPVDGEERIFVNVVSASGARYASGAHVWWSKGDSAALEHTIEGTVSDCTRDDQGPDTGQ